MLCAVTMLGLALLSFWPIVVVVLPFLLVSFVMAFALIIISGSIAWYCLRRKILRYLAPMPFFLLPFQAIFMVTVVSIFSVWWSLALGLR